MKKNPPAQKARLIAIDGLDPSALLADARQAIGSTARAGISRWDASGVFQELAMADQNAGTASARTLLLLYAADLAFRLRWEIRPSLAEGRTVIAAPYINTAVAFGRAAGLSPSWLNNLFRFAPRATMRRFVHARAAAAESVDEGFVAFGCEQIAAAATPTTRRRIVQETAAQLRRLDR